MSMVSDDCFEGSASVFSTAFCMTNNMLGAGLLTLPYAMYRGSIIGGLIMLTSICGMSAYSVLLLTWCADATGQYSYKAIAVEAFGSRTGTAVEGLVCVLTFFSCVAYSTLVGDFVPRAAAFLHPLAPRGGPADALLTAMQNRHAVICMCLATVDLPLCLLRDLRSLRFSSVFAVACITFAGGVVVYYAAAGDGPRLPASDAPAELRADAGAFVAVSLMSVAFTMHYNALRYYRELAARSAARMAAASACAHSTCLALYGAVGVAGYLTFGAFLGGAFVCPGAPGGGAGAGGGPSFIDPSDCQARGRAGSRA
jgi:sodium-coupled neutral amino acid transporter 11